MSNSSTASGCGNLGFDGGPEVFLGCWTVGAVLFCCANVLTDSILCLHASSVSSISLYLWSNNRQSMKGLLLAHFYFFSVEFIDRETRFYGIAKSMR